MDEEWKNALDGFAAVWQRVNTPAEPVLLPPAKPDGTALLRRFLSEEAGRAADYAAIAGLTAGRGAETLRSLATDCRQCRKRLETAYFLLSGDAFLPEFRRLPPDGFLGYLRRAYLNELAGEQRYGAAAERTPPGELRSLYEELTGHCARRRERVRGLVQGILK